MTPARRAWYDLMIADEVRNAAYRRALAMYAPGRVVVDVGAGLGHLTNWALEAGAKEVIAIEVEPGAEQSAGVLWPSTVRWIERPSWQVCTVEGTDVVVAEVFDSSGVGEGAIETLKDARRFLRPGGIMIPDSMRVHFCLMYAPLPTIGLAAGKLATIDLTGDKHVWGAPTVWFDWCPGEEVGIHVQRSGDVYGFGLAFTLALAPGVSLSNLPSRPATHWKQGALPFAGPIRAERGQVWIVRGDVDHSRDRLNPDVSFNVLRIEGP